PGKPANRRVTWEGAAKRTRWRGAADTVVTVSGLSRIAVALRGQRRQVRPAIWGPGSRERLQSTRGAAGDRRGRDLGDARHPRGGARRALAPGGVQAARDDPPPRHRGRAGDHVRAARRRGGRSVGGGGRGAARGGERRVHG